MNVTAERASNRTLRIRPEKFIPVGLVGEGDSPS